MATVAQPTSISNGTQVQESDQHAEHGPPRFTAVNGKETTALQDPSTQPMTANQSQSREAADYVGIDGNTNSSRLEESQYRPSNAGKENTDEYDSQESLSPTTPGGANTNKRKRSESIERHSYQQDHLRLGGDTTGIPARVVPDDNPELSMQQEAINSTKLLDANVDYSGPPPTGYSHTEVKEDQAINGASGSWQDYDSHLISQAQKAQTLDTSDAQLVEALQRETHSTESVEQKSWVTGPTSASGESDQRSAQPYSQEKPQVAVQIGPKRKRVFSNRTKTGCLTCRRRKKKCDEQHPACNNCIRGGFVCEGYSSRSTWQKPSSSKTPVPLQSKEGYTDAPNHYMQDVGGRHHERAPTTAQQSEVNKARAVVAEENDGSGVQYLGGSANVAGNRNSWPKRSWPGASHPPYLADHMAKPEYREVPPIHELSREGQQPKAEYHVVPSIRELSQQQGSHAKPGMPIFQSPVDQRPPHPSPLDTSSPQAQARLALSIEHQLSARHNAGEDTERDKMVHGELYRPFDMQLVEDRDRCKSALWRFNNACSPQSGISSKEQNRLLREVIIPPVANSPSGSPISRPSGSIGPGVIVEAPFRCHYGFNIHIGEDVMISENCSMIDDCPINIGAHTWIGPNVTILGSMAHANMQERKGSQSRYQGRPVTIEEDCYVGANCTIYPGVRLRRGAYVAPGEVVKSDIVAYGFQGLKPSYM